MVEKYIGDSGCSINAITSINMPMRNSVAQRSSLHYTIIAASA